MANARAASQQQSVRTSENIEYHLWSRLALRPFGLTLDLRKARDVVSEASRVDERHLLTNDLTFFRSLDDTRYFLTVS